MYNYFYFRTEVEHYMAILHVHCECECDAHRATTAKGKPMEIMELDRSQVVVGALLRGERARPGLGRRVPDPVARGGEHDEDDAGDGADDDGERHDHLLLLVPERRVEARHRVGVRQQRHRREDGDGERGVHEVPESQPVLGEVPPAGGGAAVGEGEEAPGRHEAVLDLAVVGAHVAVGEGGEGAEEGGDGQEDPRGDLVPDGAAVARVGHDRVQHLVHDHRRRRQQLQHVADALERHVRHARRPRGARRSALVRLAACFGGRRCFICPLFDAFFH